MATVMATITVRHFERGNVASRLAFEGLFRAELRAALCRAGWPWPLADDAARVVVQEALRLARAERPSWAEGQLGYSRTTSLRASARRVAAPCWRTTGARPIVRRGASRRRSGSASVRRPDGIEIEPDAWCAFCGTPLPEAAERDPRQKYRGRWCAREANRPEVPPVPKRRVACAECGEAFETHHPEARFCSPRCWRKDYHRRTKATRPSRAEPPPEPKTCEECGQTFQPIRRSRRFCSARCLRKARVRRIGW